MARSLVRTGCAFVYSNSGAAAVEMAIVFPLFLTVVLGICSYGMYFGAAHSTQQLAADAARASVAGLDTAERISIAREYVVNNAPNYPLLWPEKVQTSAGLSEKSSKDFVVTVTYDASSLPIWGLSAFVPLPNEKIERSAVVHQNGPQ
jgi:Flp pilus assembly protein TadG